MVSRVSPELHRQFVLLADAYRGTLAERLAEIDQAWANLREERNAATASRLRDIAHGLVGSAGTFGLPDVTEAARPVDEALAADAVAGRSPAPSVVSDLGPRVAALKAILAHHVAQA